MNILAIYYSQTGQIEDILKSMFESVKGNLNIDYVRISAEPEYPFPWNSEQFFDVFPESKNGISCNIKELDINTDKHYDLVVIGLQVWYLEPSIPIASFLKSKYADIINDKPVITVYGIRNMWINAHRQIKELISNKGGKLSGNIVFADRHNNLISVMTIVRWLFKGKKDAGRFLPAAGVSDKDLKGAKVFGKIIADAFKNEEFSDLQNILAKNNAVKVDYHIMKTEFAGSRIFNIWASTILKKSNKYPNKRKTLLKFFKYYLFFVIYIISPISSLIFRIIRLIFRSKTEKEILNHISLT